MTSTPPAPPEPAGSDGPAQQGDGAPRRRPPDQSEIRGISTIASLPRTPPAPRARAVERRSRDGDARDR